MDFGLETLNIISCPSCSRVENEAFVQLAEQVKEMTAYARDHAITIAVMGCRVNGPGETDDADLGLWCGPTHVNLKRGPQSLGSYPYGEILSELKKHLHLLIDVLILLSAYCRFRLGGLWFNASLRGGNHRQVISVRLLG